MLEKAEAPELVALTGQLEAAQVSSECECVCPTISMSVDPSRAKPVSYSAKPVATADYDCGSVMVWVEDGWLSHLERVQLHLADSVDHEPREVVPRQPFPDIRRHQKRLLAITRDKR